MPKRERMPDCRICRQVCGSAGEDIHGLTSCNVFIHPTELATDIMSKTTLYYPEAIEWMWTYCIYLGPYTDDAGNNYDLGVHINRGNSLSAAIVYGPEDGQYLSGPITLDKEDPIYLETYRRAKSVGLIRYCEYTEPLTHSQIKAASVYEALLSVVTKIQLGLCLNDNGKDELLSLLEFRGSSEAEEFTIINNFINAVKATTEGGE